MWLVFEGWGVVIERICVVDLEGGLRSSVACDANCICSRISDQSPPSGTSRRLDVVIDGSAMTYVPPRAPRARHLPF